MKKILLFCGFLLGSLNLCYAQPSNDDCASAVTLVCGAGLTAGTTVDAVAPDDPIGCASDYGVWYTFVGDGSNVTVNSPTTFDHELDIFSASAGCGSNYTTVICRDSSVGTETYTFTSISGTTYYVYVAHYSTSGSATQTGTFDIEIICVAPPMPPANDDCGGALPLTVNPDLACGSVTSGTILGATASGDDEAACFGTEDDDVWFSFVATSTSHNIDLLNAAGSTTDLYHSLWSGSCGSLVNLLCSDPNNSVASGLTIGDTYYLRVYSWTSTSDQTTTFDVCISTESCVIPVATVAVDPSGCPNGPSVTVDITDFGSATSIDITDDQGSSSLTVNAVGTYSYGGYPDGTTVVITLTFSDANGGNTDCDLQSSAITLTCPPSNDDCPNAISLTVNPDFECGTVTPGTIVGATASGDDETSCFGTEDDDVWFSFVATDVSHNVELLNITGGTTDLYHSVWSGMCGALVNESCSDPNSSVLNGLTIGDTYYLRVYSWTGTPGQTSSFDVCIGSPPPPPPPPACDESFFDSGVAGNYSANENITTTICPDNVGDVVTTTFTSFLVEGNGAGCWDNLFIYDGNSTAATPITPTSLGIGTTTGGFCFESATDGTADLTGVAITSTSADGCLTFTFTSDGSGQFAGWEADVTCDPPASCDATNNLELPPMGTPAVITAAPSPCDDPMTGFTYYEDPTTGEYMFAIDWGTTGNNDPAKAAAVVTITVQAMPGMAEGGVAGVSGPASWSLGRYWDVDLGAASLVDDVTVRFYYDPAEKAMVEAAANGDGRATTAFRWFKTTTGAYPGMPTPSGPANELDLTNNLVTDTGIEDGFTYAEFTGISSFSGGTFVTGVDAVVPVELHSLKGRAHEKHNTISWSTASEFNNDYQMLQTSYDGNSNWIEVDRVKASNRNELSHYSIQDDRPRMESYYRVKSVDFDGYTAYSNTIMVDRSRYGVKGISALVSPNPFNDRFEVTLESDTERKVSLTLLDIQGRVIVNKTMNLANGINKNTMSMEQYETGIYLLRIATDDYEEVIKLVKN